MTRWSLAFPVGDTCAARDCELPPRPRKNPKKGPSPRFCSDECNRREYYNVFRRRRYGITSAEFDVLLEEQGSACAICRSPDARGHGSEKAFHIDHDHVTGEVRGLLCANCNRMLGQARDDPEILRAAADYLER